MADTLYKVRMFVNETHKRGNRKGMTDRVMYQESVIVENADHAREVYKSALNDAKCYSDYSKYSGKCELFIPHQFDNGELAYWPDGEQYIDQFEF